jgi:hypothetical protein
LAISWDKTMVAKMGEWMAYNEAEVLDAGRVVV